MFKHEAVVEQIGSNVSSPSFQVIDLANPQGVIGLENKEAWVEACTWGSSCGGCSASGTCTGGSSCVGCSNSFNNPRGEENGVMSAQDLLAAVMG
jgi:hypothetical protein